MLILFVFLRFVKEPLTFHRVCIHLFAYASLCDINLVSLCWGEMFSETPAGFHISYAHGTFSFTLSPLLFYSEVK